MSALDLLEAAALDVVEAGGVHWRIRKIDSATTAETGVAKLIMLPSPSDSDDRYSEADADAMVAVGKRDMAKAQELVGAERLMQLMQSAVKRLTADKAKKAAAQDDAVLCAGVTAISTDEGATWDEVRFVLNRKHHDKEQGRLHISCVPHKARNVLVAAVWSLTTEGGLDAERLAAFRSGS